MSAHGDEIRRFILRSVSAHPGDLVTHTATHFGISRQAAGRHARELVESGKLRATGAKRDRRYALVVLSEKQVHLELAGLQEHVAWTEHIRNHVSDLPRNVVDMWNYGCTEMINNAIDHSSGTTLTIAIRRTAVTTEVDILDDGVGIFSKIKDAFGLEDERHAVLELSKGKLTTDQANHTGEGIFFTSRIMDQFAILSGEVYFSHEFGQDEDWILQRERPARGTFVFMVLENDSRRTTDDVFRKFAADEDEYGFNKTVVPVRLAREGSEGLVSRSQAKRLMTRVDRFATVILDFAGVDTIGRAFADEIFRVFARSHPRVLVVPINTNAAIVGMITSVRSGQQAEQTGS